MHSSNTSKIDNFVKRLHLQFKVDILAPWAAHMNPSKKLEESTVFAINTLDLPVSKSINSFQILSLSWMAPEVEMSLDGSSMDSTTAF